MRTEKRDADTVAPEMVAEVQYLLRLFGIPYITAPMEAEAQCAWLAREGLVDGVVTDDSDVFLFGAPLVYKNFFSNAKYVESYTAHEIKERLDLDTAAMISLALLLGSDYTAGIMGIGAVLAMETLAAFPGDTGLSDFATWARSMDRSADKVEGDAAATATRRKLRRVAAGVPNGFPSAHVVAAYRDPVVDDSREPWAWGFPNGDAIKRLLWERLEWPPSKTEETLAPILAAVSKLRADEAAGRIRQQQQQQTLLQYGFSTSYIGNTDARSRTKGITSARMKAAIDSKRARAAGTNVSAPTASTSRKPAERGAKAAAGQDSSSLSDSSSDDDANQQPAAPVRRSARSKNATTAPPQKRPRTE
ncbi:hypothetical protein BC828DRAFT_346418 [Blastocladiella britannica]|nr:hypothetical protein BC828DRAFT_346418 [Blastocladiella britannica]